jgi:hypothetical protein
MSIIDAEQIRSGFVEEGCILIKPNEDGTQSQFVIDAMQWDCKNPPKLILKNMQDGAVFGPFFWSKLVDEKWEIKINC